MVPAVQWRVVCPVASPPPQVRQLYIGELAEQCVRMRSALEEMIAAAISDEDKLAAALTQHEALAAVLSK